MRRRTIHVPEPQAATIQPKEKIKPHIPCKQGNPSSDGNATPTPYSPSSNIPPIRYGGKVVTNPESKKEEAPPPAFWSDDTGQNLGSLLPPITATHTVLPAGPFGLYEPSSNLPAHHIAALPITLLPTCSPPLIAFTPLHYPQTHRHATAEPISRLRRLTTLRHRPDRLTPPPYARRVLHTPPERPTDQLTTLPRREWYVHPDLRFGPYPAATALCMLPA